MRVLVVVAHPDEKSFNNAIAQTVVRTLKIKGHQVIYHDLYKEGFNPILKRAELSCTAPRDAVAQKHCKDLVSADGIVIVHPNWWGQPPAILKGWVDRVFRDGVAYKFIQGDAGEGVPIGLLKARTALIFNTANTPSQRERKAFGDPLETLWVKCILKFCGVKRIYRKMYSVVIASTLKQRQAWLKDVERITDKYFRSGEMAKPLRTLR